MEELLREIDAVAQKVTQVSWEERPSVERIAASLLLSAATLFNIIQGETELKKLAEGCNGVAGDVEGLLYELRVRAERLDLLGVVFSQQRGNAG